MEIGGVGVDIISIEVVFQTTGLTERPRERIGGKEYRTNCQALGHSFQPLIPATEEDERGEGRKETSRA